MRRAMRLLRVLLLLLLVTAVISLTTALVSAETGDAEKVVLIGILAGCVHLAARVPDMVGRLQARLRRP
jgi:hypothetical protein